VSGCIITGLFHFFKNVSEKEPISVDEALHNEYAI
jgi:hypothetical protein